MNWLQQIDKLPKKGYYSQFNEDRIVEHIFKHIEPLTKTFVDIGAGLGISNTRKLHESGWNGVGFDAADEGGYIVKAKVTVDNIRDLVDDNMITENPDFLSIDIDGNDYWILKGILTWMRPTVICAEFNGCLDYLSPVAMEYNPDYAWDGSDNYGFSWAAGVKLFSTNGYRVVYNQNNTNIWAIRSELVNHLELPTWNLRRTQYHRHNPNAVFVNV